MKETLDEQSRKALVSYRLERADETMKEAEILAREQHYNAAANRLYYACYYAASALLVSNTISASTHAGVKTMLGMHFVSKGILSKAPSWNCCCDSETKVLKKQDMSIIQAHLFCLCKFFMYSEFTSHEF